MCFVAGGGGGGGAYFFFGALDGFLLWTIAGIHTEHQKRRKHLPSFLLHLSILYIWGMKQ
jgi:hypothetical protein